MHGTPGNGLRAAVDAELDWREWTDQQENRCEAAPDLFEARRSIARNVLGQLGGRIVVADFEDVTGRGSHGDAP